MAPLALAFEVRPHHVVEHVPLLIAQRLDATIGDLEADARRGRSWLNETLFDKQVVKCVRQLSVVDNLHG